MAELLGRARTMDPRKMGVKELFDNALALESLAERTAYLDQACAGASELRERVEGLLKAYEAAGSFLQSPAVAAAPVLPPTMDQPQIRERPGMIIGPYKLIEPIGEGGMGTVYMAQQTEPVRRVVALKIINP